MFLLPTNPYGVTPQKTNLTKKNIYFILSLHSPHSVGKFRRAIFKAFVILDVLFLHKEARVLTALSGGSTKEGQRINWR
jgi:hypothetical protein